MRGAAAVVSSGELRLRRAAAWRLEAAFLLIVALVASGSFAAEPVLDGLFPAGGARGTTNLVTAVGKFDSWPLKVWVNRPGLTFSAETNKGKFSVAISADAVPGPRLVRLYNEEGASELRFFVIGAGQEILETEPNNFFSKAQEVKSLPITINGRLDKNGDVDSFALNLRSDCWLEARVDSYRLMSKVDAVLRLVTTNGLQLAWNHDFITLDPRLIWHATNDQTVVLQLFGFAYPPESGVQLTGGETATYRLHLAVTNVAPELCETPTEKEPNNTPETAQEIKLPAMVHGTISVPDDEDRFRFLMQKNKFIEAEVEAASLGSPLEAWLKIEDADGNQLNSADAVEGFPDPRLQWKAPTNGNFMVALGSLTHRGGEKFCYRLSVREAPPDFRATLGASSLIVTRGQTNDLKVNLKRLRGLTNELKADFRDWPAGVTALTTNLVPKDGSVSIPLIVATNAPSFGGPARLFLIDGMTEQERLVPFELTTREETGYSHLLVETNDHLWLTIRSKPAESPVAKKK